jgi:pimeloyl-ACP methyl ester carboxylesterase
MKVFRIILVFVIVLVFLLGIIPLVIPVPPVKNTRPVESLADPDSKFVEVKGLKVHYKEMGMGDPPILLLHGFGASSFSWREVMQPLAKSGRVVAYDRPAFGLTSRPLPGDWEGESPYSLTFQTDLVPALMDKFGIQKAILVGNSAGGTVSLAAALKYPERVRGLVLVDAAIYTSGSRGNLQWLYQVPQVNRLGPLFVRSLAGEQGSQIITQAWHDPSKITPEIEAGYRKPLLADNWDKALWEFTRASRSSGLEARLKELQVPVLVVTGDDDRIVPTAQSLRLATEIPNARLVVFSACGHVPQEECPQNFLEAINGFLTSLADG